MLRKKAKRNIFIIVGKLSVPGNVKILESQVNFFQSGLPECLGLLSFLEPNLSSGGSSY